jgi:dipeptidyl aminopeptidase/acylaminoacyl peptidase
MSIAYRLRMGVAAAVVAATALLAGLAAQSPRRMSMVDVINVPRVNDAQLSPDGNIVVYLLNVADWKVDRKVSHIWRQDIDGGPNGGGPSNGGPVFRPGKQLTFGDAPDAFPRWSPDGKSILFFRGGQLFLESVEGGDPQPLTHHATPIYVNPLAIGSIPSWSPDGAFVYFLASDSRTAEERERDKQTDESYVFEENFKQRHLWKIAVSTGAEQKLTDGDSSILSFRVSRDGRRIAFHRAPTPILNDSYGGEVWLMDADGANPRALTHNSVAEDEAELSPDNQHVLFLAGANQQLEPYYQTKIFVMPVTGGTPKMLEPGFAHDIDHASWAPDGKSIYAVVNMGVHSELFQFDPDGGAPKQLTDGEHSIQFWSISGSAGKMVFGIDEPTRLADVWTMPLAGGAPTRVTGVYDTLAQDFALPQQQRVIWKSTDGSTIEGLLYQPIGYEAGKRYPLVVQLHTGPEDSDKFGAGSTFVNDYVALLAARGYAVLKPNYRGSTGYGDAFKRDVVGGYFRHMADDVLTGVDDLIDRKVADPDRLIVMGWSAGGTLTNKLITMTDRFKAASSGAGVADWISMFSESDSRTFRIPWFGGTPWQKDAPIAAYWDHSPLKDVAKVRTPTIFLVGENDVRVPKEQSIEMYRALKSNGVPTKLYMVPREGHAWGGLRHELFKANVELEWFERYAMGRGYAWEKPPSLP